MDCAVLATVRLAVLSFHWQVGVAVDRDGWWRRRETLVLGPMIGVGVAKRVKKGKVSK